MNSCACSGGTSSAVSTRIARYSSIAYSDCAAKPFAEPGAKLFMLGHLRFRGDPHQPGIAFQRFVGRPEMGGVVDSGDTQLLEISGFAHAFPYLLEELAHLAEILPGF